MTNALDSMRKVKILEVAVQFRTSELVPIYSPRKKEAFILFEFWVAILGIRAVFTKLLQPWCIELTMHNPIQRFVRS